MNWVVLLIAVFVLAVTYLEWRAGYHKSKNHFPQPFHWYGSLLFRVVFGLYLLILSLPQFSTSKTMSNVLWRVWFLINAVLLLVVLLMEWHRLVKIKRK